MSMKIDSIPDNSLMMSQLQEMQSRIRQMQTLASEPLETQINASNTVSETPNILQESQTLPKILVEGTTANDGIGKFEDMLRQAFEDVNKIQNESSELQTRFDLGDRSVTLSDVMLASQKSSISFEATMRIRNQVVEAYKSIMQMTV